MSFDKRAKDWDRLERRVKNAKNIANIILKHIKLEPNYIIADIGAGTGLLSSFFDGKVKKIIAIDNSVNMLNEFKNKAWKSKIETKKIDLESDNLDIRVDGFISSMTLHHIKDIKTLFKKLYSSLNNGGFIALADLDLEDGSFHSNNSGVYHFGFDFNRLKALAKEAGFREIEIKESRPIQKEREYRVKVLIGKRD
ncbi:MAG: methyltransferase domain-containing protein [Epsilonproteobacteria bacterium]|nr:methyltransferase domain-containing protein [Campylobacterota bacterium]